MPFEVLHIDKPTAESIRMDNVYSEIMYLYRQGVRYWFNDAEIEELHLTNAEFEVQTIEFEMLTQYFEKPTEEEEALFFMTTAQVLAYLRNISPVQLSEKGWANHCGKSVSSGYRSASITTIIRYMGTG